MQTNFQNHTGRKIAKIRELKGMKQETLAQKLGVSQQTISAMENSEEIDDVKLSEIATALEVSKEVIKAFNEDAIVNYFANFYDNSANNGAIHGFECTFNPIDKVVELYERLIDLEREKNEVYKELFKRNM